jgi:hypothetical protein
MTAPAHLRMDATGPDAARFDATGSGASASSTGRGGRGKLGSRGVKQQVAPSSDGEPAGTVSTRSQYARANGTLAGNGSARQASTEDEGSDFQSILHKFSSSQTDEEDGSQESTGDGSQTQSGSDSGAPSSGTSTSGATTSAGTAAATFAATASSDMVVSANEILPFMLAIPKTREPIPGEAILAAGSPRGAGSAQSIGLNSMGLGLDISGTLATGTNSDDVNTEADRSGNSLATPQPAPVAAPDGGPAQRGELAFAAKLIANTGDSAGQGSAGASAPASAASGAQALQKSTSSMSSISTAASISSAASTAGNEAGNGAANDKIAGAGSADLAMKPSAMFVTESIGGHAGSSSRMDPAAQSSGTPVNTMPASARLAESLELPRAVPASPSDITVRIPDSERGTDVRFVERAGEVHVSVRTSDAGMAQTLRSGLNDFAARLEHGGIKAEMWRPSSDNGSGSPSQNQYGRRPGDQRGSQDEQSGGGDSQNSNQNSKKPKWVEALEMSIGRQA